MSHENTRPGNLSIGLSGEVILVMTTDDWKGFLWLLKERGFVLVKLNVTIYLWPHATTGKDSAIALLIWAFDLISSQE